MVLESLRASRGLWELLHLLTAEHSCAAIVPHISEASLAKAWVAEALNPLPAVPVHPLEVRLFQILRIQASTWTVRQIFHTNLYNRNNK